mgnify:CR=1 FL=1
MAVKNTSHNQATADYKGMTKKEYHRKYGSSTRGREKGENCHATSLDKAMIKYPRSYRVFPEIFDAIYAKKEKFTKKGNSGSTTKSS